MKLNVCVEVEGVRELVGTIETLPRSGEEFRYADSWLARRPSFPLSLSLPLTDKPYAARAMRPYFDGLLPEEGARTAIARRLHVSSRAYVKLLSGLGDECIGAVSFYDPELEPHETYRPIGEDRIAALSVRAYEATAELSASDRFSLAGSQAKLSLYRSPAGGWYEALGGAPSTHILKPVSARFGDSCLNEAICMIAARRLGLNVPCVFVLPGSQMLCVERYDRAFEEDAQTCDGLPVPRRLHQEDMAQALGVVPEHKYEDSRTSYLADVAGVVRDYSTSPLEDLSTLWEYVVFNCLIGNCDAHLKNYGIVRSADWTELRLAPLYDVLCTTVYCDLSREMGLHLAGARSVDAVDRATFGRTAQELMIPSGFAFATVDRFAAGIETAVEDAAEELEEAGAVGARSFGGKLVKDMQSRLKAVR